MASNARAASEEWIPPAWASVPAREHGLEDIMYYSSPRDRKIRLAKRAKKSDSDFLHAQLVLAGQTVTRDMIVGASHAYYFDCGCLRTFHLDVQLTARETLEPCEKHTGLLTLAQPRHLLR